MPDKLACLTCLPPHDIETSMAGDEPVTPVLCDQNFPPVLPTGEDGKCVVVIRVEDEFLSEIESVFSDRFKRFCRPHGKLPPGSVVLLGSLSHLAAKGLAVYAKALVGSMLSLRNMVGDGVNVMPFVPIPLGGVGREDVVWSMVDLDAWITSTSQGQSYALGGTREVF